MIEVDRRELLSALSIARAGIERRTTIPVLSNALLTQKAGILTIEATDQAVGVQCRIGAKGKDGQVCIGASVLHDIAQKLDGDVVRIDALKNNWVTVGDDKAQFKIVGLDPLTFPAFPTLKAADEIEVGAPELAVALGRIKFAFGGDANRPQMMGAHLLVRGSTLIVEATDGHRMARAEISLDGSPGKTLDALMPPKGVDGLLKAIGGEGVVNLRASAGVIEATYGTTALSMRQLEGDFPDIDNVIPANPPLKIQVDRVALGAAIERVAIVASERTHGIKLAIAGGAVEVSSINPDLGEAVERVQAEHGAELTIGFNAQYIAEALRVAESDNVEIAATDDLSPIVMRGQGQWLYVAMPMRL